MECRERVLTAIDHREPDRVPIDLGGFQSGITAIALQRLRDHLGMRFPIEIMERVQQLARVPEELLEKFRIDTRYVFPNGVGAESYPDRNAFRDEWGILWEKRESSYYYEMIEHPLASVRTRQELARYPFPSARKKERTGGLRSKARSYREKGYALFTSISGTLEESWYLSGLEKFLLDVAGDREYTVALLEKVMETQMELYGAFFEEVGDLLDVVEIWGDLTGQSAPLFSPNVYRDVFKPLDAEYIRFIQKKTNARIAWHCCGAAIHYLPDLIDIGVEILNPVQVSAAGMDTGSLKKEYGRDLCFWGGVDTQFVLPRGTRRDVEDEVKTRIDDLAPGGGYILASVHNIQPDVPPENIIAMFETAADYGSYR
jgi:uroporphyrinogen decarboxylase